MTITERTEALENGQRVRRPSWPDEHYLEAEGTGVPRKAAPSTTLYYGYEDPATWPTMASYEQDFVAEDFEIMA